VEVVEAACDGVLLTEPRGTNGFGYDPLFFMPERGRTMAELSLDEKSAISHRARALSLALPLLRRAFGREEAGRAT
jgi:XTP/dITP diphosphohydrolase